MVDRSRFYLPRIAFTFLLLFLLVIIIKKDIFVQPKSAKIDTNVLSTEHSENTQQMKEDETVLATQSAQISIKPTPTVVINRFIYLGMWTQGFWDEGSSSLHPEVLSALEATIGKRVAIAHYYRGWEALDSPLLISQLTSIANLGWRPMLSANPYFFGKCESKGLPLYRAIANGNCDDFLHAAGKNLHAFGKPMFLRFAWEMNIPSMEWNVRRTGSTNEDFKQAWRHIHDIIYSEGATNVLFVFSVHIDTAESISSEDIYPGDKYVDWTALDGYNWGTTQSWSSWQDFKSVFSSSYEKITTLAPSKPLMIAEVNTTDIGGSKEAWYTDMLNVQIPQNFAKIKAIVFYNEDRSKKEHVNWLINTSNTTLEAFKKGIQKSFYSSSF